MELGSEIAFNDRTETKPRYSIEAIIAAVAALALADSLGAPIEGMDMNEPSPNQFVKKVREQFLDENGEYKGIDGHVENSRWSGTTDDTEQALFVFEVLAKKFNTKSEVGWEDVSEGLVAAFVDWASEEPKGIGGNTLAAAQAISENQISIEGLHEYREKQGRLIIPSITGEFSYDCTYAPTNSAVPRAISLGLAFPLLRLSKDCSLEDRLNILDVAAEDVTRITHGFDECIESSQASSALIYLLLSGMDKTNALELIKERYGNIVDEALGQMDQKDVWGGGAVTTLGVALKSYELNNKPKEVILGAINAQMSKWCKVENWSKNPGPSGPDTDSYAILAAAFVAAEFIGQQRIGELQEFVSEMLPEGQDNLLDPLTTEIIEQRVSSALAG